jgi:hypothetical protein
MKSPFTITSSTNSIRVEHGTGETTFTVTNTSGRPLKGRAELMSAKPEAKQWLGVAGKPERFFDKETVEQFVVQLKVPPGAPEGEHTFQIRVADVADPNESLTTSPAVGFKVAGTPPPPTRALPIWIFIVIGVVSLLLVGGVVYWAVKPKAPVTVSVPATQPVSVQTGSGGPPPPPQPAAFSGDFFAVVDQTGRLVRGDTGGVTALRYGPGRYEVSFNTAVTGCAYTAAIGDPANALVYGPGLIFTAGGHNNQNGVYIETKNMGGGLSDYPFHLSVNCTSNYAVVNGGGGLVRGNAQSVSRLGPGRYEVSFAQPVNACAYTATIGDPANALVYGPGLIFTAGGHNNQNGVYIETKNMGGGLSDYPFHLSVNCSSNYAVVNAGGGFVRGNVRSVFRLGPGRYEVSFAQPVNACAYTATIGDPANGLVYGPGLIFTAGGHTSPNGVYIETKNMGGGLADYPFHVNASCAALSPTTMRFSLGRR